MNQLIHTGAIRTMNSRELAEIADKRHDNVMRVIEALDVAKLILPQLEEVPNDGAGPKYVRQYRLNQRDSYVVMARLKAEAALAVAAPKAEALDRISTADGLMCITNAAKALQIKPKALFGWLQQNQWIYRRPGGSGWTGYQARIQVGYLSHKVTTVERSDGSDKQVEQVLVTAKGLAKLAGQIADAVSLPGVK